MSQTQAPTTGDQAGPAVAVCADPCSDLALQKVAARLSLDLDLPMLESPEHAGAEQMLLVATPTRLELRVIAGDLAGGRPVWIDLSALDIRSGPGRSFKQPLAKAIGVRSGQDARPTVIDATAGWGEDSWLLAAMGCHVLAVERNRIVATLLRDALFRAGALAPQVLGKLNLVTSNACDLLRRLGRIQEEKTDLPPDMAPFLHPDVVYLDPMFPTGRKAAEGKAMRVLRLLVGGDEDAGELLEAALTVASRRVVVKRPLHAPPLTERQPNLTREGKAARFDVYVTLLPPPTPKKGKGQQ